MLVERICFVRRRFAYMNTAALAFRAAAPLETREICGFARGVWRRRRMDELFGPAPATHRWATVSILPQNRTEVNAPHRLFSPKRRQGKNCTPWQGFRSLIANYIVIALALKQGCSGKTQAGEI